MPPPEKYMKNIQKVMIVFQFQAVMNWVIENPFVLSMNLHDGATVACYPFDDFYSSADEKQSRAEFLILNRLNR